MHSVATVLPIPVVVPPLSQAVHELPSPYVLIGQRHSVARVLPVLAVVPPFAHAVQPNPSPYVLIGQAQSLAAVEPADDKLSSKQFTHAVLPPFMYVLIGHVQIASPALDEAPVPQGVHVAPLP